MSEPNVNDQLKKVLEIPIAGLNFANTTKWIFNIPVGYLFNLKRSNSDGQILEYPLNCKRLQFPEFRIGTGKTSFMSYSFDVSSRQNLTEKRIDYRIFS